MKRAGRVLAARGVVRIMCSPLGVATVLAAMAHYSIDSSKLRERGGHIQAVIARVCVMSLRFGRVAASQRAPGAGILVLRDGEI
ncbi:hypothetical protein GCM10011415_33190 [Salipiger pallidus]|uniref:Uncharacterized protein n=1 Tax=Salipiger pallidus TaxID=1775170 RepID=A0A8J3EHK5_9RHOB|nr:hypothetical protein GCM10011415_33190 [Salipiger pallidus]